MMRRGEQNKRKDNNANAAGGQTTPSGLQRGVPAPVTKHRRGRQLHIVGIILFVAVFLISCPKNDEHNSLSHPETDAPAVTSFKGDADMKPFHSPSKSTATIANATSLIVDEAGTFNDMLNNVNSSSISSVFENMHWLMIGDSLTRYQYLHLVYFIKHGKWVDSSMRPNPTFEDTYPSWTYYFNSTNSALLPEEQCDCFRQEGGFNHSNSNENRYFSDTSRNISITYIQKMGSLAAFKSSWNATDVHNEHLLVSDVPELNYVYNNANWTDFIQNFVSKLEPKPEYVIFNEGLWGPSYYDDPAVRKRIIQAISDAGMISVYKTTTRNRRQNFRDTKPKAYELDFCELADLCYNVSWTGKVTKKFYWDWCHFHPPVYEYLNLQLFELLLNIDK